MFLSVQKTYFDVVRRSEEEEEKEEKVCCCLKSENQFDNMHNDSLKRRGLAATHFLRLLVEGVASIFFSY